MTTAVTNNTVQHTHTDGISSASVQQTTSVHTNETVHTQSMASQLSQEQPSTEFEPSTMSFEEEHTLLMKERKRMTKWRDAHTLLLARDTTYQHTPQFIAYVKYLAGTKYGKTKTKKGNKHSQGSANASPYPIPYNGLNNYIAITRTIMPTIHYKEEAQFSPSSGVLFTNDISNLLYNQHKGELLEWCNQHNLSVKRSRDMGREAYRQLLESDEITNAFKTELPVVFAKMRVCQLSWGGTDEDVREKCKTTLEGIVSLDDLPNWVVMNNDDDDSSQTETNKGSSSDDDSDSNNGSHSDEDGSHSDTGIPFL